MRTSRRTGAPVAVGLVGVALLAFYLAAPGVAAGPSVEKNEVAFSGTFPCEGFDVFFTVEGFEILRTHFDDGEPVRVDSFLDAVQTLTNVDTGKTFTGPTIGRAVTDFVEGTFTIIGLGWRGQGDGGEVILDVGRLVLNLETFEILLKSGHWTTTTNAFLDSVCSIME